MTSESLVDTEVTDGRSIRTDGGYFDNVTFVRCTLWSTLTLSPAEFRNCRFGPDVRVLLISPWAPVTLDAIKGFLAQGIQITQIEASPTDPFQGVNSQKS